jgi:hypothetical protein
VNKDTQSNQPLLQNKKKEKKKKKTDALISLQAGMELK